MKFTDVVRHGGDGAATDLPYEVRTPGPGAMEDRS